MQAPNITIRLPVLLRIEAWMSSILVPVRIQQGNLQKPEMEMRLYYHATGNNGCIGPFPHFYPCKCY